MGPDIIVAKEDLDNIDESKGNAEWIPFFDPDAFKKDGKPLTLQKYQLNADQLLEYGGQVSELRRQVRVKADLLDSSPKQIPAEINAVASDISAEFIKSDQYLLNKEEQRQAITAQKLPKKRAHKKKRDLTTNEKT